MTLPPVEGRVLAEGYVPFVIILFCYLARLADEIPEFGRAICDYPLLISSFGLIGVTFFVPSLFKNGLASTRFTIPVFSLFNI